MRVGAFPHTVKRLGVHPDQISNGGIFFRRKFDVDVLAIGATVIASEHERTGGMHSLYLLVSRQLLNHSQHLFRIFVIG